MDERLSNSGDFQESVFSGRVPPQTPWTVAGRCWPCGPLVKAEGPGRPRYFLRHWECEPGIPIGISLFVAFLIISYFVAVPVGQKMGVRVVGILIILILLFLFLWAYFSAMCSDPGFLPFNWILTRRSWYSWQEQLSGLALTPEQQEFAVLNENRPPGCCFSRQSGRYVIHGDHICGWTANWIGKRNMKQFLLLQLYGGLLGMALFGFKFAQKKNFFKGMGGLDILVLVCGMLEVMFGFSLLCMFVMNLVQVCLGKNRIETHKGVAPRKLPCSARSEAVCGNDNCCLWCCPTHAFDEYLVIEE
jgi:hypothetical protein